MQIIVNATPQQVTSTTLAAALEELGFTSPSVATALNGAFVARGKRAETQLRDGDQLEVLAPMQGG